MRALAAAAKDIAKELGAAVLILIVARDFGGLAAAVLAVTGLAGWFAAQPVALAVQTVPHVQDHRPELRHQQQAARRLQTLRRHPPRAAARGPHRPPISARSSAPKGRLTR